MKARERTGIDYYMRADEVDALQELGRRLPPHPVIVNIGAALGTSAAAFLEARPDALVLSVDVQVCPEEAAAAHAVGTDPARCVRLLGRSQEIGAVWPYPVDAVFIDGAHDYAGCQEDYRAWWRHVRPGGWVAFHDYGAVMLPTVKQAVDDLAITWEQIARVDTLIAYQVPPEETPNG